MLASFSQRFFTFAALFFQLNHVAAEAYINGQFFTNGLAIIDSPAPQHPGHAGSPLPIAIEVSGDGKIPISASSNNSDASTRFELLEIYLVSSAANINITVSTGPALLANESGSTVKHVNWPIPTCIPAGDYNLTFYETSLFNNQNVFTITPIPIPISNTNPDGQCSNLNTLQSQPQSANPLTDSPFAPNSTLPGNTPPSGSIPAVRGTPALVFVLISISKSLGPVGYLEQTFYFDYNIASQPVPVPVTTQCETIHINWKRGAGTGCVVPPYVPHFFRSCCVASSPDPVAPYFLQIYTSAFVFPFIVSAGSGLSFDWAVPFAPGTLYQMCMFDKNGNSGGCQGIYSVVADTTTTTPTCNNATFPLGPLEVDAVTKEGPLSQYGWVDQCTDIQVTPKNGTAPYIFTVAPTLHPPHNQTGMDQNPMNWTVNLSWGSPFFISVVDAEMNFWAYGPLHSGQGTTSACFSGPKDSGSRTVSPAAAAISSFGGLLLGIIVGAIGMYMLYRRRNRKYTKHPPLLNQMDSDGYTDPYTYQASPYYHAVPTSQHPHDTSLTSLSPSPRRGHAPLQRESTRYQIEPFIPPSERRLSSYGGSDPNNEAQNAITSPTTTSGGGSGNIYVVHHDAGRAPVTVYHQDGTEVVELPPRYVPDAQDTPSRLEPRRLGPPPTDGQTSASGSSYSVSDLVTPPRSPNRPRKHLAS
ncbi:hypothetical protein R3P38DRAFT_3250140 [Favolaschia claudopus]|uniref:Uncharacterized protein n=1 Tax=Favolaschia claudopus TaxID=2862362 RepID=A0AAW0EJ00_9AGAR